MRTHACTCTHTHCDTHTHPAHSEYADFRVSSDGELQGVGLLLASQPVHNHLLVLGAIRGGPADRAGIASGVAHVMGTYDPIEQAAALCICM